MPRKKWRQLLAFLSCGGLGRKKKWKHNDSPVALEGTRSWNDTISINFEEQEGDARETEVSNSPHAGIEVERFQGREATAHSHVQTIEVHQQWPPGDAQADLLGSDMQMKTVRDRAGATKVDASNEVTDMASGNATTPRALTWKDMQSVAESTHDNMDISADLQSLGDKSDGVDLTTMQGSEYPISETQSDLEKPTMLHEKSISLSEDDGSIMPVPPQHSWQMLAKGTTSEDSVAEPGSDCEKPSSLPVQGRSGGKSEWNLLGRYIPESGCGEPRFDDNVKYNIATKPPLAIDRFYKDDSILGLLGRTCHGLITYPVVEPNTGQAAGQLRYSRSLPSLSSLVNYNLPTDWSAGQSKPPFTASEANESVVTTRAVQCSPEDAQLEQERGEISAYTDPLESELQTLEIEKVPLSTELPNYIRPDVERLCDNTSRVNAVLPTNDFLNMTSRCTNKLGEVGFPTRSNIYNSSETKTFRTTTSATADSCNIAVSVACAAYATTSTTGTTACAADGATASSTDATTKTTASTVYDITGTTGSTDRSKSSTAKAQRFTKIANSNMTTATTCGLGTTCVAEGPDTTDVDNKSRTETGETRMTSSCCNSISDGSDRHLQTQTQGATADLAYENSQAANSSSGISEVDPVHPRNNEAIDNHSGTEKHEMSTATPICNHGIGRDVDTFEGGETAMTEHNDDSDRHLQTQTQGATADLPYENSHEANSSSDAQLEHGKEEVPAYTDPLGSECFPLEVEDVPPSAGLPNYIKPSRVNALAPTTDFPNMTGHGTDKLRRGDLSTRNRIPNSSETDTFRATTSHTVTSCITTACAADGTTASSTDATIKTTSSAAYAITGITGSTDRSKNFTADAQAITEIATTRTTATTTCAANDTKSTTATSASATGATMSTTATTTCTLDATTRIAPTAANVTNVPIGTMIPSASATMEINTSVIPLSTPNTTRGATTAPFNPEDVAIVSTTSSAASTAIKAVKEAIPVQPTGDGECPDTTDVENNMRTEADGSDRHLRTQTQGATADLPYENSQAADSSSAERLTRGRTWQQRSPKTRSKAASHLEDESKQRSVNITSNESTFSPLALSNRRSISGEVVISVNPLSKQNPRGECQPVPGTSNSSIKRNTSIDGLPADRISSVIKPGNLMSTQGPSQHEGERDVRPKTSSRVAFHTTAQPDRSRVNREPLLNGTGASSSVGLEVDDADQLLEYLSIDNTIERSSPIPEDVKQFITNAAQEKGIECGVIYQCPEHTKDLNIIGYKASSLTDFLPNMREKFPGFSFLIKESDSCFRHVEEYGDGENTVLEVAKWRRNRHSNNRYSYDESERSTSELVLTGMLTKNRLPYEGQFMIVPAHMLLKEGDVDKQLLQGSKTIAEVREELRRDSDLVHYSVEKHNSPKINDMEDTFWFSYRHYINSQPLSDQPLQTSQTSPDEPLSTPHTAPGQPLPPWHQFTNDIALLQLKKHQLGDTQHRSISLTNLKDFCSKISHTPEAFTKASFREHDITIGTIFPLKRVETLKKMGQRSVRVFLDEKKGYMVPCGEPVDRRDGQRQWTFAIDFVVPKRIFKHGDCGLIVYVQDSRPPCKLYPFGLYTGKSLREHKCCGLTVNTAVVLRQGIDDIEHNYRHLVRGLKPLSDRTDSRHVDGHNWVGNLSQIPTPTSATSRCDGASAAAAPRAESGYETNDVIPEPTSCQPEGEEEDEQ